ASARGKVVVSGLHAGGRATRGTGPCALWHDGRGEQSSGGARVRLSLRLKLSLLIISLLAATVVLVSSFLLRTQQRTLTDEMSKRGRTIAQNLAAGTKTAILTGDDLGLQLLVRDVARDGDVVYVVVTDSTGTVIAHSDLTQIGRALERPEGTAPPGDAVSVRTLPL